ncbi:RNA 2'-phosphotransferase [Paenibacillus faecalis]|uniref:RNA 2'-phosphotransferase n=1 Tax=Paenibacillus faecalis TaxID=2079532 RepID=UPI000D0FF15B|nr:RNA 2'-phosphotransferase [Paenibacillus faecalis]
MAHALRHAPWEYELEMDSEGWVETEQLVSALRLEKQWVSLQADDLINMLDAADKKRYEIRDGKIRALYGHSFPQKITKTPGTPPPVVYHGTPRRWVEQIMNDGLRPMGRQYVHLAADPEMALTVGKRKDSEPVLLGVYAEAASKDGILFYQGNHTVWLADYVPSQYIYICQTAPKTLLS